MQSGQAIREAVTLEREKEMEFNTIMQALVKDIAEQLRPMVVEMVKQEIANTKGDTVLENIDLPKLAKRLTMGDLASKLTSSQLSDIASDIDLGDMASKLTSSQLSDIASNIDLGDLAGEFDADKIHPNFDLDDALREFFQNNNFSISP